MKPGLLLLAGILDAVRWLPGRHGPEAALTTRPRTKGRASASLTCPLRTSRVARLPCKHRFHDAHTRQHHTRTTPSAHQLPQHRTGRSRGSYSGGERGPPRPRLRNLPVLQVHLARATVSAPPAVRVGVRKPYWGAAPRGGAGGRLYPGFLCSASDRNAAGPAAHGYAASRGLVVLR